MPSQYPIGLATLIAAFLCAGCADNGTDAPAGNGTDTPAAGGGGAAPALGDAGSESRPNVLLIISDDFGIDVTSDMYPGLIDDLVAAYGPSGHNHPQYQLIRGRPASTPTLNRLARDGMVFTGVWAHPFCSPTRASILTGTFGAKTGVLTYADPLDQNQPSFVRMLKEQGGYATALFGKWHLAGLPAGDVAYSGMKPKEAGFDVFRGNMHAAIATFWDYDYQLQDQTTPAAEWREVSPPERSLPGIAPTTFAPVVKVADTLDWIRGREAEDGDQPWFAWLAFNLSHATIRREPSQMAVPDADTLDAVSRAEMEACGGVFGTADTGECTGEQVMRAMTNAMDTLLGRLFEAVDSIDPNTYVIYVSDNGTPMYGRPNLDFIDNMYISRSGRGKGSAYESGARVAMAVRGPDIVPGSRSDAYVHTADLFATILSLAGLESPAQVSGRQGLQPLDSVSLTPVLFDGATSVRDPDYGYVLTETENLMTGGTRIAGARNARFKLICVDGSAAADCEFYDLGEDPLEEYPLAEPDSCEPYRSGAWTSAAPAWHYCRLTEVVEQRSFLQTAAQ